MENLDSAPVAVPVVIGIKETLELMSALECVLVPVKAAIKDKHIGVEDVPHALTILKNYQVIIDGILGDDKVVPELKDIDSAELAVIGGKFIELVQKLKDA